MSGGRRLSPLGAVLCAFLAAGGFARPARASELDNARAYCARINAHWVGGDQQCACNSGYTESNNTCVPAGDGGGSAPQTGSFNSSLGNTAAGLVGGALGRAFSAPAPSPYIHVRPTPVVNDEDEALASPKSGGGMGDVDDILKGYHATDAGDGAVRILGETPQLLRAAEQPPLISGASQEIEDFKSSPAEAPATPSDVGSVSLEMLKNWGAEASDDAKAVITKVADLEQRLGDLQVRGVAVKDGLAAAAVTNDYMTLLNNSTKDGTQIAADSGVLDKVGYAKIGVRAGNICSNGTDAACDGAKWGAGLAVVSSKIPVGGTILSTGAGLGSDALKSINQYNSTQQQACEYLGSGGCAGLGTTQMQKNLSQTGQGLFDVLK